jgi:hypothetical protein
MAFNYSPKIVTDGLVLAIDAANYNSYVSGSTRWNDISRGGFNTTTLYNGPTFNSANGGSIVFDGTNDYANAGSNTSTEISGNLTIESVVYPTSFSNQGNIICKYSNNGYRIRYNSDGAFFMYSNGNSLTSPATYTANQWYHLTAVFSSTGLRMYINGVLVNSNAVAFTPTAYVTTSCYIATFNGSLELFQGRIAIVKLYNRSLNQTEITQNFNTIRTRFGL